MLATISGVEFNPESSYDDRKETWKISNEIYRTINISQSPSATSGAGGPRSSPGPS